MSPISKVTDGLFQIYRKYYLVEKSVETYRPKRNVFLVYVQINILCSTFNVTNTTKQNGPLIQPCPAKLSRLHLMFTLYVNYCHLFIDFGLRCCRARLHFSTSSPAINRLLFTLALEATVQFPILTNSTT